MPATTPCSECGKDISRYPCAFCGAKSASSSSGETLVTGFLTLAVFLGVIWGFAALVGGDSGSDPEVSNTEPEDRWTEAYVMCQDLVEDRLRAPGTADFPFGSREYVTTLGGDRYRVETYVDAENAFGAMLRSDFTCTVEHRSGDRWRLRNLEITER